jgi:hypothetical protein
MSIRPAGVSLMEDLVEAERELCRNQDPKKMEIGLHQMETDLEFTPFKIHPASP